PRAPWSLSRDVFCSACAPPRPPPPGGGGGGARWRGGGAPRPRRVSGTSPLVPIAQGTGQQPPVSGRLVIELERDQHNFILRWLPTGCLASHPRRASEPRAFATPRHLRPPPAPPQRPRPPPSRCGGRLGPPPPHPAAGTSA